MAALAVPAQAAVTLATTGTGTSTAFGEGINTLQVSGFDVGNGNALAVVVNTEIDGGAQGSTPSYTVTFGGAAIFDSVTAAQGTQGAAVFWLLGVTADTVGDIVVDVDGATDNNDRIGLSVVSLQNVTGVGNTATNTSTDTTTLDLTYVGDAGGFAIGGFVDNAFGNGSAPSVAGGNLDTTLQAINDSQSGGSAGILQSYGLITASGSSTETFTVTDGDSSSRNAAALVAFVPEPSVALLGGLGVLVLLRRRCH